jgi:hypothetical protein
MATRSFISRSIETGFEGVYCHWDGYPEYVGAMLHEHWSDPEKIEKLIELGDISTLGSEIGEVHDFDDRATEATTFYGRDRGETEVDRKFFAELDDLVGYAGNCGCEFIYLFDSGNWYFIDRGAQYFGMSDGTPFAEFKRIDEVLGVA